MDDLRKPASTLPLTAIVKTNEGKVKNKVIHFVTQQKYEKLSRVMVLFNEWLNVTVKNIRNDILMNLVERCDSNYPS
ncbi:MAG: hypothetical protein ABI415_07690 [Flavitalea sp.]